MNYREEAEKLAKELDTKGVSVAFEEGSIIVTGDYGRDDEISIPVLNASQIYYVLKALNSAYDTGFKDGREAD